MKSFRHLLFPSFLAAVLLPVISSAQVASGPAAGSESTSLGERTVDLTIEGTNLDHVADLLRSQIPELNVLVPPVLKSRPIGPLKLRNVTVSSLSRIIP